MDVEVYKAIGGRIRRVRESIGLSQEDLAHRLGYQSPATISHFESGDRKVSIADLQRVAEILGIPLSFFLSERPSEDSRYFRLRASEVRPGARTEVAAFLSFAHKHGSREALIPEGLSGLSARRAAERILELTGTRSPPVMPTLVAKQLNIPVFEWEFPPEISGIFVSDRGTVSIGVNQAHPRVRQRFTIGHEVGHCVFADGRDLFLDFSDVEAATRGQDHKYQELEMKANWFAADLLMPTSWIRQDVNEFGADVSVLARRYDVSEQALWFRLMALKLVKDEETE